MHLPAGSKRLLLFAIGFLTCGGSRAQTAFEQQLSNLNRAIVSRENYNKDKRKAEFAESIPAQLRTQLNFTAGAPNPGDSNRAIGTALTDIVDTLATGTAAVYAGAGLTQLNVHIAQTESTWKSDHVRNGFDKARPFLDIAGNLLVGASLVLTSQGN